MSDISAEIPDSSRETPGSVPIIDGHVDIGVGAKIFGNIKLGDHSRVGANAVVLDDVEPHDTVVGIPAKSIAVKNEWLWQ